ncbi:hypothetical protein SASPL_148707 [Salvia splendens]|uniref:dolichyl-diphosphooligosaccharide--protein glycotransferase n=1 Tax=Salvia splendens TaxID=180675 RepID=A0A8X8WBD3_SALSN|nr:hypothetical protein SASPL_148707 [Salvia splendens]
MENRTYASKYIPIIASVSEHQPPTWPSYFMDINVLAFLVPAGIVACFLPLSDASSFAVLYIVTSVYFSGVMVRLMLVLAPAACIMSGIALSEAFDVFTRSIKFHLVGTTQNPQDNVSEFIMQVNQAGDAAKVTQNDVKSEKSEDTVKERSSRKSKKKDKENIEKPSLVSRVEKRLLVLPLETSVMAVFLLVLLGAFYVVHCVWVAAEAYSAPSIVLTSRSHDGLHVFDDFREAYAWLSHNTEVDDKVKWSDSFALRTPTDVSGISFIAREMGEDYFWWWNKLSVTDEFDPIILDDIDECNEWLASGVGEPRTYTRSKKRKESSTSSSSCLRVSKKKEPIIPRKGKGKRKRLALVDEESEEEEFEDSVSGDQEDEAMEDEDEMDADDSDDDELEDYVASWWDYGYQTTAMANRTVIVDNNTWNNTHIATVGTAMSSPEKAAWDIFSSLDVKYVLVVFGGLVGYPSDDINKFLWMVRIGGGVFPHIKEPDYLRDGQYRIDSQATPTMLNSLMYKLSYFRFVETDGRGYDRVRNTEIGKKHFKLTHFEEVFTTHHWMVRIYKLKSPKNRIRGKTKRSKSKSGTSTSSKRITRKRNPWQ